MMRKCILIFLSIISTTSLYSQTLPVDSLCMPMMRAFYNGCLAINQYLVTKDIKIIENALEVLNPGVTKVDRFLINVVDGDAIIEQGEHAVYDYSYIKSLIKGQIYSDRGLARVQSDCYVETLTIKANSTVKISIDVSGEEPFYMFAMCEPQGTVALNVEMKSDLNKRAGVNYENNTVSYVSWFIPKDDTLIISIMNTSNIDESVVIASN